MPIFGWDASDFDWSRGPMDLGAAVRDGIAFFTHKATEGTSVKHVRYRDAMDRAVAAGMPLMGAYVVPRTPGNNGHGSIQAQVNYFLAYLDSQTPWWRGRREFFLQVDLEHWGYDDVAAQHGVETCRLLRAAAPGKWVVLYAPRWAYGDSIPGSDPLWASAYGKNPALPYRQAYRGDNDAGWAPYSGRTPVILQYGSRTTIGSQPTSDANAFRGSLAQLRNIVTGGEDDMDPVLEDALRAAFVGPYNTAGDSRIGPQSWVPLALERPLRTLLAASEAEKARDAATATQIAGLTATVSGLTDVIKAGGGNVETAAIGHLIQDATDRVTALVEQRHNEEMAVLDRDHAAEVAALRAQLAELTAGDAPAQG